MTLSESDHKAIAQWRISMLTEPKEGQVYKHWKGGYYSIKCVSIMEDTLEILVTYTSNLKGGNTTRPLAVFLQEVEGPDGVCLRFTREES